MSRCTHKRIAELGEYSWCADCGAIKFRDSNWVGIKKNTPKFKMPDGTYTLIDIHKKGMTLLEVFAIERNR